MKAGLTTSVVLHAAVLGFGLLSLSAPAPLQVADVEALPVDIVPIEEMTQIQQGDKKAPMAETPAPMPTKRPDIVADARKVGENDIDTDNPPTPADKPRPVKTAEATAPAPKPVEKPKTEDTPKPPEEPKPVPATEVAPVPAPRQEVKPEPVKEPEPKPEPVKQPEPKPAEKPQETAAAEPVKPDAVAEAIAEEQEKPAEQMAQLPDSAPRPEARPRPAPAETAKAPERKTSEKPVREASSRPQSEDTGSIEQQINDLLNKDKAKGGGAKRSTPTAALGGKKTTGGKLSNSEEAALREQLSSCWALPIGMEDGAGLRATIRSKLTPDGRLDGRPTVESSSGNRAFDESAIRAMLKCDRQGLNLPAGKADIWGDLVVNFDPSEMLSL
jgi:colicin import membrane protein